MTQTIGIKAESKPESALKISAGICNLLCCPRCKCKLFFAESQMVCAAPNCGLTFPVVDGVPLLINEDASLFSADDIINRRPKGAPTGMPSLKDRLRRRLPKISKNIGAEENYQKFQQLLLALSRTPRVLVIGGSVLGKGMESFAINGSLDLVETDVSFGPRTSLICDAHDIPFADESFDGIIVQAVLEHVVDPYRCVSEIHRVLKSGGLVYAETPFMQQVHMGRYDFTRFTHLGHRRLFRAFEEIESGAICGPGMALAWAYQYFFLSFAASGILRSLLMAFARLTSFYLKYFDSYLINKPGTFDAASGFYFIGRKGEGVLSDRELIQRYRGAL